MLAKLERVDKQSKFNIPVRKHEDPPWAFAERGALARRQDALRRNQDKC